MENTFLKKGLRVLSVFLVLALFLSTLGACQINDLFKGGDKSADVKFEKIDDGYALNRFKGTSALKEYTVPNEYEGEKVTALNPFSLANAEYLEELKLGPNIEVIDIYALTNCPSLKNIKVDPDNEHFKDVDGVLYTKDGETLLAFPNKNTEKLLIEPGVVNIRDNAFYKCSYLKEVTFPDSLKKVGNRAFIKCRGIVRLDLPDGLEEIGEDAFSFLHAAEYIYIPATVKIIGNYGFFDASKVELIKMGHESADELQLGRDWNQKKDVKIAMGTPLEWGAER
ncbi:MAG: leucine-rich repeat domain-containing protein [Clostridiales bacterium]|nr:leucine-rich repeat domain-containing protein [Clostridiales bacterium]